MNIRLSYLYRDAGNYKNYNDVIFPNPLNVRVGEVEPIIKQHLIEDLWFVASDWQVPDLHFKDEPWNNELDHHWHEFETVEETTEVPTTSITIDYLLTNIKANV